jgi:hypothetical protein
VTTPERGTAPKPFVFVVMPFDKAFDDIYEFGIKGAAADAAAYAERTSEQMFDDSILDRVVNQISKADVVVADMTGRNPNVYYEVGYAHAIDKVTILITQSVKDIPFDLKDRPHLEYAGSASSLRPLLAPRLAWAIEESRRRSRGGGSGRFRLDVVIHGTRVPDALEGAEAPVFPGGGYTELQCEIVNQGLETSPAISHCYVLSRADSGLTPMTTDRARYLPAMAVPAAEQERTGCGVQHRLESTVPAMPPGAVETVSVVFEYSGSEPVATARLRLFLPDGPRDFPFQLRWT